jgi:hypothetical protein
MYLCKKAEYGHRDLKKKINKAIEEVPESLLPDIFFI